ncbi:MAG: hypothetical protein JJE55_15050 [Flavobacteriaceae bacterium]|nr:hypothetical protein [Flavobacteriaceae bacterium]
MKNIKYSGIIVSTRTKDGDVIEQSHRNALHIGNENLADFNNRMNTRTVLEYDHNDKSFKIDSCANSDRLKYLSNEFVRELNRFLILDRNANFDENFIKIEYVEGIEKDVSKLQQEIRRTHRLKEGGLSQREKEEYLHWIQELITLRENSFPIGVLTSKDKIEECKKEVNLLCEDLSKELVRKSN